MLSLETPNWGINVRARWYKDCICCPRCTPCLISFKLKSLGSRLSFVISYKPWGLQAMLSKHQSVYIKTALANGVQKEIVISRTDYKKVQKQYASLAIHTADEINQFIQTIS